MRTEGRCPWCCGPTHQETVYIDRGFSVPVEPEHCLECGASPVDWRYGNPRATEEEMATGCSATGRGQPEYWSLSPLAAWPPGGH